MWSATLLSLAFCLSAAIAVQTDPVYTVPEPLIEVFSPKGLRVSIPDSKDVQSVEFFLSFSQPLGKTDPGEVSQQVTGKEGSHWIFWNPSVVVRQGSVVFYRLMVQQRGLYWNKEGQYRVDKVISLSEDIDCEEVHEGETQGSGGPSLDHLEEHNLGKITAGRKAGYKSSYSMFKSGEMKPITRSTTTTTSGTFYIKPTGVEGSGYKTSSSFDSTRQEGEQWHHSRSQLSGSEIEELKRLHGDGFHGVGNYPTVPRPAGSYRYEESYYSQNGGAPVQAETHGTGGYQQSYFSQQTRTPGNTFKFQIPIQVAGSQGSVTRVENSESSHLSPSYVPSSASYQKHEYRKETSSSVAQPETASFLASNLQTVEKPVYTPVTYEYQRKESTSSSSNSNASPAFTGNIFTTYTVAKTPQECAVLDIDHRGTSTLRDVERSVTKLSCLATLAEGSLREELRRVREDNGDLRRKFQLLEDQLERLKDSCDCLQIASH